MSKNKNKKDKNKNKKKAEFFKNKISAKSRGCNPYGLSKDGFTFCFKYKRIY